MVILTLITQTWLTSTNASMDYVNTAEEEDRQSLAESYMMFKIGLIICYFWI